LVGGSPDRAVIELHGSFAMTGEGHGTKRAIVGGLLGMRPNDVGLRDSLQRAADAGLEYTIRTIDLGEDAHPNTARIHASRGELETVVTGCSIGGGRILVQEIDEMPVSLSGTLPTVVVVADDVPGTIADITGFLARRGLNLATMRVDRTGRGERALMTIEADGQIPPDLADELAERSWIHWVRTMDRLD
jgi:L-serine dehydratase